jgi:predicted glycosyltransferase
VSRAARPSRPLILVHCQHLLGLGHAVRAARLARAVADAGERVLLVTGGAPLPELDLDGIEVTTLPPLTAHDETAGTLATLDGGPPDAAFLAERRARLLELLGAEDPAVVLLELFPFGRHALAFELVPLLLAVADDRARRGPAAPRVVVSLRDVLVGKRNQPWYELAVASVVDRFIDRVMVHGSPALVPLSRTFGLADRLGDRLVYTGYLAAPASRADAGPAHGEVVVSAGGGRVAEPLFRTALAARAAAPTAAARPWRVLTGPYLPPPDYAALEAAAGALPPLAGRPAVIVERFRPDLAAWLRGAALSVSQAGYNTVLDVLAAGVPAVVVPYEGSGDEQPLRARLLAERGLLRVVDERELSPARLAAAMEAALTAPAGPPRPALDLDGARRAVTILRALVDEVASARQPRRRR